MCAGLEGPRPCCLAASWRAGTLEGLLTCLACLLTPSKDCSNNSHSLTESQLYAQPEVTCSEIRHIILTVTSANENYTSHWTFQTHTHVFI